MFLVEHDDKGRLNAAKNSQFGTFALSERFRCTRPPGPPRIPLVHWPAPSTGQFADPSFLRRAASAATPIPFRFLCGMASVRKLIRQFVARDLSPAIPHCV